MRRPLPEDWLRYESHVRPGKKPFGRCLEIGDLLEKAQRGYLPRLSSGDRFSQALQLGVADLCCDREYFGRRDLTEIAGARCGSRWKEFGNSAVEVFDFFMLY